MELINHDLPSNFCCYRDSENGIVVVPRLEELGQEIILNIEYGQLIEQTMNNPLADPVEISECYMYPEPFPAPIPITIKTVEGNEVILNIKRQPCKKIKNKVFSNFNKSKESFRCNCST